jgi:hypothetical protein
VAAGGMLNPEWLSAVTCAAAPRVATVGVTGRGFASLHFP